MAIRIAGQTVIHDDERITSSNSGTFQGLRVGRYGSTLDGDNNPYTISTGDSEEHDLTLYGSSTATLHLRLHDGKIKMGSADPAHVELSTAGLKVDGDTVVNNAGEVMNLASNADLNKKVAISGSGSYWSGDGWAGASATQWNTNQTIDLDLKVKQSLGDTIYHDYTQDQDPPDTGSENKGYTWIGGVLLQWGCTGFIGDIGQDHLETVTFATSFSGSSSTNPNIYSITTGMLSNRHGYWNDNIDGSVGVVDMTRTGMKFRFDEWGSVHQSINFCYQAIGS